VTGTEYLIHDHLGSTRLSMNNQGQVVRRYDFLPFGEEIVAGVGGRGADYEPSSYLYPTVPDDVLRKFTSKERDSETGLDFFGARYFSSAEGRFVSADWSAKPEPVPYANLEDPQTLNLFGYVRNNPMAREDADGHCAEAISCAAEAGAAIGTGIEPGGGTAVGAVVGAIVGAVVSYYGGKAIANHIHHSDDSGSEKHAAPAAPTAPPTPATLPAKPDDLKAAGYKETTHPAAAAKGHLREPGDR
jgi:RHS repeat-associated protein